jgi:DNA-directed RNA polymerase specialized sigma24 family protein
MLGSVHDAENAMQDALLAAWQGLGGFERRASVRTWLYRVTTSRCLNVRRSARRQGTTPPGPPLPEPAPLSLIGRSEIQHVIIGRAVTGLDAR